MYYNGVLRIRVRERGRELVSENQPHPRSPMVLSEKDLKGFAVRFEIF